MYTHDCMHVFSTKYYSDRTTYHSNKLIVLYQEEDNGISLRTTLIALTPLSALNNFPFYYFLGVLLGSRR